MPCHTARRPALLTSVLLERTLSSTPGRLVLSEYLQSRQAREHELGDAVLDVLARDADQREAERLLAQLDGVIARLLSNS